MGSLAPTNDIRLLGMRGWSVASDIGKLGIYLDEVRITPIKPGDDDSGAGTGEGVKNAAPDMGCLSECAGRRVPQTSAVCVERNVLALMFPVKG